jgi:hypothetical protein
VGLGILNRIGRVLDHNIDKFIELVLETRKGFNQKALLYNSSGEDSPPVKKDRIILIHIDGTGKYIGAGVLTESQGAKPGEKIFFSRNADGEIQSIIKMLDDGSIDANIKKDLTMIVKGVITDTFEKAVTETYKDTVNKTFEKAVTNTYKDTVNKTFEKTVTETYKDTIDKTFEKTVTNTYKDNVTEDADGKDYNIKAKTVKIEGTTEIILMTIGSATWIPNCVQFCPFGFPHGGQPGGITGLKGE